MRDENCGRTQVLSVCEKGMFGHAKWRWAAGGSYDGDCHRTASAGLTCQVAGSGSASSRLNAATS